MADLGIWTKRNTDVRGYNGQSVRADLVAVLDGEYDLGWVNNSDGSYDLIADLWGVDQKYNQVELINSINQKYAVNKILADKRPSLQNADVKLFTSSRDETMNLSTQQDREISSHLEQASIEMKNLNDELKESNLEFERSNSEFEDSFLDLENNRKKTSNLITGKSSKLSALREANKEI